jgi:acyl-CoA hydrolase
LERLVSYGAAGPTRVLDSPEEILDLIPASGTVYLGSGAAEPTPLLRAMFGHADRFTSVDVVAGLLLGGYEPFVGYSPFRLTTWYPPPPGGPAASPRIKYVPLTWRQVAQHLRRQRADVAVIQLAPADADGFHSPGISASHVRAMTESATQVIAEVNAAMPQTLGTVRIHCSELAAVLHTNRPLPAFPAREPQPEDALIAGRVADLVPMQAAVQFGIGAIPAAVARELAHRGSDQLRIFGQLGDWGRGLIGSPSSGPVPRALVAEIGGLEALYRWVHRNPAIQVADAETTHATANLFKDLPRIAINSALEVDLTGQVNCEVIGGRPVGPLGGLLDIAMATQGSADDRLIIALRAVASSGASRIVARLSGPVGVPRALVHIVATEHGIADLTGLSVQDRVRALVAIADPRHRVALLAAQNTEA